MDQAELLQISPLMAKTVAVWSASKPDSHTPGSTGITTRVRAMLLPLMSLFVLDFVHRH